MAADDSKLQSFLQWLQANGAELRGCTIRACGDNKGYGVFLDGTLAGNGVVMAVPLDLAITPMSVLQDPAIGPRCKALFEEEGPPPDDRFLVMLFLLVERLRPHSPWKPYLDMLPSSFGSSIWFTEDELLQLKGTTLFRATILQKKSLEDLFVTKVKGLAEELLHSDESVSGLEVQFEDFLWANSIFWTRALNIPFPHAYVYPGSVEEHGSSNFAAQDEETSQPLKEESVWVEGLVPGIDFCNHRTKAMATWEVDPTGTITGIPSSMYLVIADQSSANLEKEVFINYGNKGNEELLYLYGFVMDNNPDDYIMVNYPVEALKSVPCAEIKSNLLEVQKVELRCLLSKSLLENGFFGDHNDKENKKSDNQICNYSWSGQRKVPSYIHKNVFPREFLSALRTIRLQEHELDQVYSLLSELLGSSEDGQPSANDVESAIWEVCGDHGAFELLVDLLQVKLTELMEGSGPEAADIELLEKTDLEGPENFQSGNDQRQRNYWSSLVYRRGQKQLAQLFLREAEHLLELCGKELS